MLEGDQGLLPDQGPDDENRDQPVEQDTQGVRSRLQAEGVDLRNDEVPGTEAAQKQGEHAGASPSHQRAQNHRREDRDKRIAQEHVGQG